MNFNFFAFASKASTGEANFKKYTGIANCRVIAVNPTKKELEEIYGNPRDNEPVYLGVNKETNAPTARIEFILETVPEKCNGISAKTSLNFFLEKSKIVGSQSGKIQVIDRYAQNAWATEAELASHTIPQYANGPANIDKDYWPAYVGQIQLLDFFKAYLGVSNVRTFKNGVWTMSQNPGDCEAKLDHIDDYFKGDFSELKFLIGVQPSNSVRTLWGVRDKDGKEYQVVYNEYFQKAGATSNDGFEKHVTNRKSAGAYPTTTFDFTTLHEYTVSPTNIDDLPVESNPADNFFND